MISDTAKAVASAFPDAFSAALAKYSGPFSTPTDQDIENAANQVVVDNLGVIAKANDVAQGRSVDASRLKAGYLGELNRRGVTEDSVTEFAQRAYPHLSGSAALKKWQEQAAKMPDVEDLSYGAVRESSD